MAPFETQLAQLPILQGLEPDEFALVTGRFVREQFPRGSRILEEGYGGLKLFVMLEGRIRVYRTMGDTPIVITTLEPPETFGEISIIDGNPISATVEAESDVVVLTLSREDFYEIVQTSCVLQAKLYGNLLRTLCQRLRTTTNQVHDYFAINKALCENESFRQFYKLFTT
ncbi:MAG: cyclic nucleotide-binding domain-containing protein [Acidobacteriota bacterium]